MHHRAPDQSRRTSWVHRLSPELKLWGTLVFLVGTALLPRTPLAWYISPAVVVGLAWMLSRMPLRYALRRLVLPEFFVVGLVAVMAFSPARSAVFWAALIKSNLCIITLILLGWTTPFYEIVRALARTGLPSEMVSTLTLMQRYGPVLIDESRRMQRARSSRTFRGGRFSTWAISGGIIAQLFIRTLNRAERIYLAMCARGWK